VSTKSGEKGRRGDVNRSGEVGGREVGRREKLWGREEAEKTKKFGHGRMFWFIPKTASTASCSTGALVAAGSPSQFCHVFIHQHLRNHECCSVLFFNLPILFGSYFLREPSILVPTFLFI
jgi:hypothetical protein